MHGSHGSWRRTNCNAPLPYVCQRPADGSRPQLPPPPGPPHRSSCPPPWQQYGPDRCLRLFNQTLSWRNARQWCRDQADRADLISVPSAVHQGQSVPQRVTSRSLGHSRQLRSHRVTWAIN